MRKTILYIAMSLDGFIADSLGEVDWLQGDDSDPENPGTYDSFAETVDTIVMGRTTYEQIAEELSPNVWPYPGLECFVITERSFLETEKIRASDNPVELVDRLKKRPGRDIWIAGGAKLVQSLLKADRIDQFRITIIPVILGCGIRLFEYLPENIPLKLKATLISNGMAELIYERRPD